MKKTILAMIIILMTGSIYAAKIEKTFSADEFDNFSYDGSSADIFLQGWEKNEIKIVLNSDDNPLDYFEIKERGKTLELEELSIENKFGSSWFFKGHDNNRFVSVYLPVKTAAIISTASAAVGGKEMTFKSINTASGDILLVDCKGLSKEELSIETASGEVILEKIKSKEIIIKAVSGDLLLTDVKFEEAFLKSVSGEITITNSEFGDVYLNTVSGESVLKASVFSDLSMDTISGDTELIKSRIDNFRFKSISADMSIYKCKLDLDKFSYNSLSGEVIIKD